MNAGQIIAQTLKLYGTEYFFAFTLFDDMALNLDAFKNRPPQLNGFAVRQHQDLVERHWSADFSGQFLDPQDLAFLDFILFASGRHYSVHIYFPPPNGRSF